MAFIASAGRVSDIRSNAPLMNRSRKIPPEYVPGRKQATYSIPFPRTLKGIYAPIKNPTAALIIPIKPPSAEVERKNDTTTVENNVAESMDKNIFPIMAKTAPVLRYQPDTAKYIKPIARIRQVIANVQT